MASREPVSAETKASARRPSKRLQSQVGSCTRHLPAAFPFAGWALSVEQRRANKLASRPRVCRATLFRNRSPNACGQIHSLSRDPNGPETDPIAGQIPMVSHKQTTTLKTERKIGQMIHMASL